LIISKTPISYVMKIYPLFILFFFLFRAMEAQVFPPPANVEYESGILTICPPDSVPGYTGGLMGYNVYMDDEFIENLPAGSPQDTVTLAFDPLPLPGNRIFCVTAVYQIWISDKTCDSAYVHYGYELPFTEDWSSGSFNANNWTQEGNYWTLSNEIGNPSPSAEFHSQTVLSNYSIPLTSYSFIADTNSLKRVHLEFYIKLECINSTGNERLYYQQWNWMSQIWQGYYYVGLSNENGSFDWVKYSRTIYNLGGGPFMIRIIAEGENSADISAWYIDNLQIYQTCQASHDLSATENAMDEVELEWEIDSDCGDSYGNFLNHYHYGVEYFNSIGTGSQAEFDVAAYWTPELLVEYDNISVGAIYFYPAESNANYTVRIWEGDSADLVYEQGVADPQISQWNKVLLDSVYPVDISRNLWIGYHIETMTGYPAGVDEGPAYNGYGNMMYWEGQWSTLLEINPELDFNWLIDAYIGEGYPMYCANRIYRKINDGDYTMIAEIHMTDNYLDSEADITNLNCYKITNLSGKNADTCESYFTNESCVQPVNIFDEYEDDNRLMVYPNPAGDQLFIEMPENMMEIQLLDMTGRVVYEIQDARKQIAIKADGFSIGIYLLKVSTKDGLLTRKILIK